MPTIPTTEWPCAVRFSCGHFALFDGESVPVLGARVRCRDCGVFRFVEESVSIHDLVRVADKVVEELQPEIGRLRQGLWDCALAAGMDGDGEEAPRALASDIVEVAVGAVRQLRKDYDDPPLIV